MEKIIETILKEDVRSIVASDSKQEISIEKSGLEKYGTLRFISDEKPGEKPNVRYKFWIVYNTDYAEKILKNIKPKNGEYFDMQINVLDSTKVLVVPNSTFADIWKCLFCNTHV